MTSDKRALVLTALVMIVMISAMTVQAGCSDADSSSEPPLITIPVGSGFCYVAETNLDSEISASGDVLSDDSRQEGTFLSWDPETDTLSGTATDTGDYIVVLTAVWTSEDGSLLQTTTQTIEFEIVDSDGSTGLATLTYDSDADEYNLEFVSVADTTDITDAQTASGTDLAQYWWAGIIAIVGILGFLHFKMGLI